MEADFISEVFYPDWLANVVMVKKINGKWRMCVNFTDLNKVCPKDNFPLPRIDQLVDSTAGHKLLSFMDTFSGYNQILMDEEDQEKISFITSQRLYCYKVMLFRLKNVEATYQRLVNRMFSHQIRRNVEVYVDNMLVKSKDEPNHLDNLKETFSTLCKYNVKFNPTKCVFVIASGKFLGFMVSQRGIKANPEKVKAIIEVKSQKTMKEIQSLTGKVVALNKFVSRITDKCMPFFKVFQQTDECEEALAKLKVYIMKPPLLSLSMMGEKLYLYLVMSSIAVSLALIREEENVQKLVYYTSQAFQGVEANYPRMEKIAFALVVNSRKLCHYFQAHFIIIVTNQPIRKTMNKIEAAGWLIQWAVELGQFNIEYRPQVAIKA